MSSAENLIVHFVHNKAFGSHTVTEHIYKKYFMNLCSKYHLLLAVGDFFVCMCSCEYRTAQARYTYQSHMLGEKKQMKISEWRDNNNNNNNSFI